MLIWHAIGLFDWLTGLPNRRLRFFLVTIPIQYRFIRSGTAHDRPIRDRTAIAAGGVHRCSAPLRVGRATACQSSRSDSRHA